jgi:hypothetical protein
MALKSPHGSDDRVKVEAMFLADGREAAITRLVEAKVGEKILQVVESIRDDPAWKERLEIQERTDEIMANPADEAEVALLQEIEADYVQEVLQRQSGERDYYQHFYEGFEEKALVDAYIEWYIDRRGSTVAMAEYALTEAWYGCRICEGVQIDGGWDHSGCNHHQELAFETKAEVRELPENIQDLIADGLRALSMTVREAKNSDRQESSSASSPLPSEPEASTPSTPDETPSAAPGT